MLKQQLSFKLSQKLSPQQIQLMKLIQLPTQAFEQRISQEMNENPALEVGKEEEESFDEDFDNDKNEEDFDDGNEVIETDINVDDYNIQKSKTLFSKGRVFVISLRKIRN